MHRRSFLASLFAPLIARFIPGHTIKASQIAAGTINSSYLQYDALVRNGLMSADEFRRMMGANRLTFLEVARIFDVPPELVMPEVPFWTKHFRWIQEQLAAARNDPHETVAGVRALEDELIVAAWRIEELHPTLRRPV